MKELFSTYTVGEVITFLIVFALAMKALISFLDWACERVGKAFNKHTKKEKREEEIDNKFKAAEERFKAIEAKQLTTQTDIDKLIANTTLLLESDKDAIKAYITKEHHYFCYQKKWIDDYSMDCLEHRYTHYKDEHGNSFVEQLMEDLRALPRSPQV